MTLTKTQKQAYIDAVDRTCQHCGLSEQEVGSLEIHRMKRGEHGGTYAPNNCLVLCRGCHLMLT